MVDFRLFSKHELLRPVLKSAMSQTGNAESPETSTAPEIIKVVLFIIKQ